MNKKKSIQLKLIIGAVSSLIIGVMFYLNYENYVFNRGKLINELQITLDNAVEKHFIDNAKIQLEKLSKETENQLEASERKYFNERRKKRLNALGKDRNKRIKQILKFSKLSEKKDTNNNGFASIEQSSVNTINGLKTIDLRKENGKISLYINGNKKNDSSKNIVFVKPYQLEKPVIISSNAKVKVEEVKTSNFVTIKPIKNINLKQTLLFSDTLLLKNVVAILKSALVAKNFTANFRVIYEKKNAKTTEISMLKGNDDLNHVKPIFAKSDFLFQDKKLSFYYNSLNSDTLKLCILPILLSCLLGFGIILCMVYFFNIIKKQNEINEMKNDFISNITHELKTPIAVVKSAIEGIQNFNTTNDLEKTQKYLSISNNELVKLNKIVEKILETASLDSKDIVLNKKNIELVSFLDLIVLRNKEKTEKEIRFITTIDDLNYDLDEFHFENIINNLLENALKYGGSKIQLKLEDHKTQLLIAVIDNGKGIPKKYQDKIFDKFYRIPTQNIHNVKGFGVGLYYVKQMVEKHLGTIDLEVNSKETIFKISLPYGKN